MSGRAWVIRNGLSYYLLAAIQMCFLTPRPARADDVCSLLAPVCIREADTAPLGEKLPLILIHGLNANAIFAPPQTDGWNNFLDYYNANPALKATFKPYLVSYYSNTASVSNLGGALCDALDKINQGDLDNFGNKNIVLVGHSMGGLVVRSSLTFQQSSGAFSGKALGERVLKIITLATPHHGSPLANDRARDYRAGVGWGAVIGNCDNFDLLFWSTGPGWNQVNRSDLRWDNYDGLLNYDLYPDERNFWLDNLNQNQTYDSKIIAYGGTIAPGIFCGLDKYCWGATILGGAFDLANDGVVPLGSAQFKGHSVVTQYFSDYNHSEMVKGKNPGDPLLFDRIRDDLLNIECPVTSAKKGVTWLFFTEGSPGMPGDGVSVSSDQGNFHPKPALALNEMTDGFTMSVFPTAFTNKLLSVGLLVRPRSSGLGFYMIYSSMEMSALTSNGINGFFFSVTQSQLQQIVKTINQMSFENYTMNDVDITELQINYPDSSRQSLDAVAIGQGQNVVP